MNCIFTIPTFVSAAIFLFVFFCYFLEGEGNCLHKVLLSILSIPHAVSNCILFV